MTALANAPASSPADSPAESPVRGAAPRTSRGFARTAVLTVEFLVCATPALPLAVVPALAFADSDVIVVRTELSVLWALNCLLGWSGLLACLVCDLRHGRPPRDPTRYRQLGWLLIAGAIPFSLLFLFGVLPVLWLEPGAVVLVALLAAAPLAHLARRVVWMVWPPRAPHDPGTPGA